MALPMPRQTLPLDLPAGATVADLVRRLEEEFGVAGLGENVAEHCLVAVNGTEVGHLGGWGIELPAGAVVSIVPAMVGG
jgi:molybdopterin converting factor small subunit